MPVSPADLTVGRWVLFRVDPLVPLWRVGRVHAVRGDQVTVAEAFALTPRGRVYRAPYPSVAVPLSQVEAVFEGRPTPEELGALLAARTTPAREG